MVAAVTPIHRGIASGHAEPGSAATCVNMNDLERCIALGCGSALAITGLTRCSLAGLGLAALGGAIAYWGFSGHCPIYQALGLDHSEQHSKLASVSSSK